MARQKTETNNRLVLFIMRCTLLKKWNFTGSICGGLTVTKKLFEMEEIFAGHDAGQPQILRRSYCSSGANPKRKLSLIQICFISIPDLRNGFRRLCAILEKCARTPTQNHPQPCGKLPTGGKMTKKIVIPSEARDLLFPRAGNHRPLHRKRLSEIATRRSTRKPAVTPATPPLAAPPATKQFP